MNQAEKRIPFNKPTIVGKELYYIAKAVLDGHLSGDGPFTKKCQRWIEERLGCEKALLTHSGTGALEMAAILLDIQAGDEVILPSFTFVSTANAFVLRGATPVFVDIRPDTLNIDENQIERAIRKRTKAIVPVHYAGVPCDMATIMKIARRRGPLVVEDAAQALLSKYGDRRLGTIGDLGCLSFHETKNIISGEGGCLLINNEKYIERAEIIWEKGTDRKKFSRGEIDKYTWVDIGSSFLPGELISSFLYAQMEQAEKIISARRRVFDYYLQKLKPLEEEGLIRLPLIREIRETNGHIFYIIARDANERDALIRHLKNDNILGVFHYIPLHSSPAGKKYGRVSGDMTVTDEISERIIRLPLFNELTKAEMDGIISRIFAFFGKSQAPREW